MKLTIVSNLPESVTKGSPHYVFVAHDGFTPINATARNWLEIEALRTFIRLVNERQKPGSLLPAAPVSALPLQAFLPNGLRILETSLRDFLQANQDRIHAPEIVFDLRVYH